MRNKKEAVEYCEGQVKSITINTAFNTTKEIFAVGLYETKLSDNNTTRYSHLDTVYMSRRTLLAYVRHLTGLSVRELMHKIHEDYRDELKDEELKDTVNGLYHLR